MCWKIVKSTLKLDNMHFNNKYCDLESNRKCNNLYVNSISAVEPNTNIRSYHVHTNIIQQLKWQHVTWASNMINQHRISNHAITSLKTWVFFYHYIGTFMSYQSSIKLNFHHHYNDTSLLSAFAIQCMIRYI